MNENGLVLEVLICPRDFEPYQERNSIVQWDLLIRRSVGFVVKCISVPGAKSYHQRIVVHNVFVATNFDYPSK